jgi:FlaA1/EpsC-like NDP-sugar epimerase/lipopolysaccharide/colanic/teichoic acid biosynthesis glycosyltransferase
VGKRVLDLCGAVFGLALSLPLLLVIAIAIKLDSSGPVLYTPIRAGLKGRPFRLYKLRSMVVGADAGSVITGKADSRITRVGRWIRLLRLDELPQLFNVLKGDMSLVGPRPEACPIAALYTEEQRRVLDLRPGITGPTQLLWMGEADRIPPGISPEQYYVSSLLPQKLQSDLWYVETRTLASDLGYIIQTPFRLAQQAFARSTRGRKASRVLADLVAVVVGSYLAFVARFDWDIPASQVWTMLWGLPIAVVGYGLAFITLKTYRGIWQYAGIEDFWQLLKACVLGGCLTAILLKLVFELSYPRTVLVLAPVLTLLLMGGARLAWRTAATRLSRTGRATPRRRVVIVGAGRTGEGIARAILGNPRLNYALAGFVDDDPRLKGAMLHNLPVLGTCEQLDELVQRHRLDEAIIAISRLPFGELRRIGDACRHAGIEFKTLPSTSQLVQGEGQLRYLRKVNLDELLRREALSVAPERISGFLRDKRVLVTGAGGSIGSELCRQVAEIGAEALLMVDRAENGLFEICSELQAGRSKTKLIPALADVKHVARMSDLFDSFKPNVIFHAAAYKHVPILESHPTEAVLNNVVGTVRLAHLARARSVETFVFISTDKAVKPSNLMGATKRVCELYLAALNKRNVMRANEGMSQFRVVRFGNVLGSAGSALPLFQRQIESGSPITITDPEMSRFFMTIQEAVALVLESATLQAEGDITVLDMGEPVRITKLADDLVTALGLPPSAVARRVIGPRPGEKLHELLWEETDEVVPSAHPRIVSLRQPGRPLEEMETFVRDLERLAMAGDIERLLGRIQELIPTYRSSAVTGSAVLVSASAESMAHPAPADGVGMPVVLRPAVNQAP